MIIINSQSFDKARDEIQEHLENSSFFLFYNLQKKKMKKKLNALCCSYNDSCRTNMENEIQSRSSNMVGRANNVTLVLDGKSLDYTLLPDLRKDFIDVCISCKAVVCCRVSPSQKAEMVKLVREQTKVDT